MLVMAWNVAMTVVAGRSHRAVIPGAPLSSTVVAPA